jgi:hypothetical protein
VTREGLVQTFDEKAALAELERLRDSIEAARQARRRTSDEFDAFVKSFRKPEPTPISPNPVATTPPLPELPPQAVPEPITGPLETPASSPSPNAVSSNTAVVEVGTAAPLAPSARRYRLNMWLLGALAAIAVVALGVWSARSVKPASPVTRATSVSSDVPATRTGQTAAPAAALPPQKTAASGVVVELRTIRPVWMRVVVDGRKDVEGTVEAGKPLHFTADHTIVVRVGNGGDVVVKIGDREESFGDTGQPRTRTFSKP